MTSPSMTSSTMTSSKLSLEAFGRSLHFDVSPNKKLVSGGHVTEFISAGGNVTRVFGVQGEFSSGTVRGDPGSVVALHHSGRGLVSSFIVPFSTSYLSHPEVQKPIRSLKSPDSPEISIRRILGSLMFRSGQKFISSICRNDPVSPKKFVAFSRLKTIHTLFVRNFSKIL